LKKKNHEWHEQKRIINHEPHERKRRMGMVAGTSACPQSILLRPDNHHVTEAKAFREKVRRPFKPLRGKSRRKASPCVNSFDFEARVN
jgi:hypothetical protein